MPGVETRWDLAVSAYAALDRILQSPATHQIVVTHGGTVTFLLAAWIRMPIDAAGRVGFQVSPGSITVLHEDDHVHSRRIVRLDDTKHLHG